MGQDPLWPADGRHQGCVFFVIIGRVIRCGILFLQARVPHEVCLGAGTDVDGRYSLSMMKVDRAKGIHHVSYKDNKKTHPLIK